MGGHSRQRGLQEQRCRSVEMPWCARPWDVEGHREGPAVWSFGLTNQRASRSGGMDNDTLTEPGIMHWRVWSPTGPPEARTPVYKPHPEQYSGLLGTISTDLKL